MGRRDEWNRILEIEMANWSNKDRPQVLSDLGDGNVDCEVEYDGKIYQVDADLLA